jgi:hypothetical protein
MSSDAGEEVLFDENGGLVTRADLHTVHGTSPVRVSVDGDEVDLTIKLSGGKVVADLDPDRAEQLGEALIEGATKIRERGLGHEA